MQIIEAVDAQGLAKAIREEKRLLVVDFWAEWCGHCRALLPILEELAEERREEVVVVEVDIDANRELAFEQQVNAAPTLLFFRDGDLVDRLVGAPSKAALTRRVDGLVGLTAGAGG